MKKTRIGNSELDVSALALGTMLFGSVVDEKTCFDLIDIYLSKGGNFIDCANKYASWLPGCNGGEAEIVVSNYIKSRGIRDKVVISSKVGFPYQDIPRSLSKAVIISECEKSLKRLNVDTIDIYFAHAFDKETPIEESMDAFYQLKKEGKIKYAGASNFHAWRLERANNYSKTLGWEGFIILQQKHSYVKPILGADFGTQMVISPDLIDYCVSNNVSMMGYSPLLGGIYSEDTIKLPPQYSNTENEIRMHKLKSISEELDVTLNQLILAWMFQSTPQVIPVFGANNIKQLKENLISAELELSEKQLNYLNKSVYENPVYS